MGLEATPGAEVVRKGSNMNEVRFRQLKHDSQTLGGQYNAFFVMLVQY